MDDNTPETDTADRFAEIRQGLADLKTVKDGLIGTTGRYGWSYVDNTYRKNMVDDLHYLLAAVDRLRAAPACGRTKPGGGK